MAPSSLGILTNFSPVLPIVWKLMGDCWLPGVLAHATVVDSLMWIQLLGPHRCWAPWSAAPQQPCAS